MSESLEQLEASEIAGTIDEGLTHEEAAAELEARWTANEIPEAPPPEPTEPSYLNDAPEPESWTPPDERQLNQAIASHQQQRARLEGAAASIDWNDLRERDPYTFQQKQAEFMQAAQVLAQQEQALHQVAGSVQLNAEDRKLRNAIPAWRDEKVASREKAEIRDWLIGQGINEQVVDTISNAKEVLIARKAMLADKKKRPSQFKVRDLKGKLGRGRYSAAEAKTLRERPNSPDACAIKLMRILK